MGELEFEIYKDWEHRVSQFLKDAIQSPDKEPEICEALCEFIMELVEDERAIGKAKLRELAERVWRPGETPEPYR